MADSTRERRASVASRVLAVLGAFDDGHRALSLTRIARRAGLPVATTHRLWPSWCAGRRSSVAPQGSTSSGG
jgi:hypothetical protein